MQHAPKRLRVFSFAEGGGLDDLIFLFSSSSQVRNTFSKMFPIAFPHFYPIFFAERLVFF
jgi:hypothetical protein